MACLEKRQDLEFEFLKQSWHDGSLMKMQHMINERIVARWTCNMARWKRYKSASIKARCEFRVRVRNFGDLRA
jgi:hypothetical protein